MKVPCGTKSLQDGWRKREPQRTFSFKAASKTELSWNLALPRVEMGGGKGGGKREREGDTHSNDEVKSRKIR